MQYLAEYSQLATRAFDNQVHNSERFGGGWLRELDQNLNSQVSRLKTIGIRQDTVDRYVDKYKRLVSACFGAESRCASSFVTGPANFPVERMRKRRESARNRWDELRAYEARVIAAMERIARREYKKEHGITPLIEAQRNLNRRVLEQAQMKTANAALRKAKSHEEREAALLDLGYGPEAITRMLEKPYWKDKYGYEAWRLSNNNAQIVRLKQRVEELKAKEYRAEQEEDNGPKRYEFDGGYVELNYQDDRLRIKHAEKPAAEIIAKLKQYAFRWSPANKAWQRQLTPAAKQAARWVTGLEIQ